MTWWPTSTRYDRRELAGYDTRIRVINGDHEVWVVYASPIKDSPFNENCDRSFGDNIEMVCAVSIKKGFPIANHRGICKNQNYILKCRKSVADPTYTNHKGISMLMHSFAAKFVTETLKYDVQYMETDPMKLMKKIFGFYGFQDYEKNIIKYDGNKAPTSSTKISGENIKNG